MDASPRHSDAIARTRIPVILPRQILTSHPSRLTHLPPTRPCRRPIRRCRLRIPALNMCRVDHALHAPLTPRLPVRPHTRPWLPTDTSLQVLQPLLRRAALARQRVAQHVRPSALYLPRRRLSCRPVPRVAAVYGEAPESGDFERAQPVQCGFKIVQDDAVG